MDDTLNDREILELAAKVECAADPDAAYPTYFSGGVEIYTRDGKTYKHHEKVNRGAGDRALSASDIEAKYYDNALLAVSRSRADAICEAILNLEKRPARDVARLLAAA
jgi:2-methylcitrate dehydratase PrpD